MTRAGRLASLFAIVAGAGLSVFVAFAPEDGVDSGSLTQGLSLGAVVAAAPLAALIGAGRQSRVVDLGGGMTIAGAVTTPGGNVAGLVLMIAGFVLLVSGASRGQERSWSRFPATLGHGLLLAVGMYAALAGGVATVIALLLALAVASSPWLLGRIEANRSLESSTD